MSKNLNMPVLLDIYGKLLTEKQQETLEMYYNSDLSLGEISDETQITRQGVLNCIRNSEVKLLEFEEKLRLAQQLKALEKGIDELVKSAESISEPYIREEIENKINNIKKNI